MKRKLTCSLIILVWKKMWLWPYTSFSLAGMALEKKKIELNEVGLLCREEEQGVERLKSSEGPGSYKSWGVLREEGLAGGFGCRPWTVLISSHCNSAEDSLRSLRLPYPAGWKSNGYEPQLEFHQDKWELTPLSSRLNRTQMVLKEPSSRTERDLLRWKFGLT